MAMKPGKHIGLSSKRAVSVNEIVMAMGLIIAVAFYFFNRARIERVNAEECRRQLGRVANEINDYASANAERIKNETQSRPMDWLERIRQEGNIPECPAGGTYRVNNSWEIFCDYHDGNIRNTDVIGILSRVEQRLDIAQIIDADVEMFRTGQRHLRLKEFEQAIEKFQKAENYNPDNPRYPYALADAYFRAGKLQQARTAIARALAMENAAVIVRLKDAIDSAIEVRNYLAGIKDQWRLIFLRRTVGENDSIWLSDIDGANMQTLARDRGISSLDYHRPSQMLYFSTEDNIYRTGIRPGQPEKIHNNLGYPCHSARISPDGNKLVFGSRRFSSRTNLFIKNLKDALDISDCIVLTDNTPDDYEPLWHPDGSRIFFLSGQVSATEVWSIGADGRGLNRITRNAFEEKGLSITQDGKALSWARTIDIARSDGSTDLNHEIFLYCLENDEEANVSRSASIHECWPSWSTDGSMVAFIGWRDDERHDLFVMNADGSGRRRLTSFEADPGTGRTFYPVITWAPNGDFLIFSYGFRNSLNLYIVDVASGATMQLTNSTDSDIKPILIPVR